MSDPINPDHYKLGRKFEVIDIIEDNIARAPGAAHGFHQGQVLKYICRMWDKGETPAKSRENLLKAQWYIDRLHALLKSEELKENKHEIPKTILGGSDEFIPFDDSESVYKAVKQLYEPQWSEDSIDTVPSEFEEYFS